MSDAGNLTKITCKYEAEIRHAYRLGTSIKACRRRFFDFKTHFTLPLSGFYPNFARKLGMQKYWEFLKKFVGFFRRRSDDDRKLMDKLRDKYRLVIMNDETFEEVTSLKLTPLSVYVGFSSLIVLTIIMVVMLIVWTPLKRYIPGYGDFSRDEEIALLADKVQGLEAEINAHREYNANLRNILTGNMAHLTEDEVKKQGIPEDSLKNIPIEDVERIPEDAQLRAATARGPLTSEPLPAQQGSGGSGIVARDIPLEQLYFIPPVSGEVMSGFDMKKNHFGADIAAPKNTAVKAAADGVVISAGYTVETGNSIAIQHPNNVVTMYKHNSVLLKQTGSVVKAGEAIAIIGNSGEATSGPHLHFELWYRGRPVDPSDYINLN